MVAEESPAGMPDAVCLIRPGQPYSQPQFTDGLKACGFSVTTDMRLKPKPDDVLLIWNRGGSRHHYALEFERVGAKVIVAENGWIGKTQNGGKFYSLALGWHNGLGQWRVGSDNRWPLLNTRLDPWRQRGDHILVLPSRGIGAQGVAMPRDWPGQITRRLKRLTKRPVRMRPHPGDGNASMADDLKDCHAVVTWGSGAAVKAIAAGVPAYYELKNWIGAGAAKLLCDNLENPFLGDRLPMFQRLAWASWTADEISTGEPFRNLLK